MTQPLRDPFCWHCGHVVVRGYVLFQKRPFCDERCLLAWQQLNEFVMETEQ